MNGFVVRQAIKNREGNIEGYEILFQNDKEGLYNSSNDAMAADTIANFLMQNNDKIFTGKQVFITFTPSLLFRNTPKIFEPGALVIQVEDNILVHPLANVMIQKYKKAGYCFAINDFQFAPRYFSMMEYIDYLKVDIKGKGNGREAVKSSLVNIIRMAQGFKKKCIVTGIDTQEEYDLAMELNPDYLEGTFISDTTKSKTSRVEYLQGNFFQLVVAVTDEEPDLEKIEEIISRDAYLTYALLKVVNSAYFAQRKRIASIRQAIVTLGITQLKQWVYLLSLQESEDKSSEEVLRVSFLRATFCFKLSKYIPDFPISQGEAYMMGMFSTLDYIVDAPMEEILEEIPLHEEIKEAILHRTGPCGALLDLVLFYEKADWQNISKLAQKLGMPTDSIAQSYFDCVEQVNEIWKTLVMLDSKEQIEKEEESAASEEELMAMAEELKENSEPSLENKES